MKGEIPEAAVEAAAHAAFVPPISGDRRADMRAALEAALPVIHADLQERLLDGEAARIVATRAVGHVPSLRDVQLARQGLEAALDFIGLGEEANRG